MNQNLTPQAISEITDPDEIRVLIFINNEFVHVPLNALVKPADISATVPVIAANTMLVDNPAGTARETKTFAEVVDLLSLDIESVVATLIAGKTDKASPFVDVASATTVDLGAASSPSVNITGTTTITSFGTSAPDGAEYLLKFAGAVTVTHSASLILPEAANVVAYAGLLMRVRKEPSNVWRVIWYSSRLDTAGGGANRIKFDAAALTASRTITLPDADVTIPAGGMAAASHTHTAEDIADFNAAAVAAMATMTAGGVGSLAWARRSTDNVSITAGSTYAGSNLVFSGVRGTATTIGYTSGTGLSGTWRALGTAGNESGKYGSTLFVRIA